MIQNDLQRLRWQFLDEALRDPVLEYFMGERTATNETGNTRSLIYYVNKRLKEVNRDWSCSKRMLQNDVDFFKKKNDVHNRMLKAQVALRSNEFTSDRIKEEIEKIKEKA